MAKNCACSCTACGNGRRHATARNKRCPAVPGSTWTNCGSKAAKEWRPSGQTSRCLTTGLPWRSASWPRIRNWTPRFGHAIARRNMLHWPYFGSRKVAPCRWTARRSNRGWLCSRRESPRTPRTAFKRSGRPHRQATEDRMNAERRTGVPPGLAVPIPTGSGGPRGIAGQRPAKEERHHFPDRRARFRRSSYMAAASSGSLAGAMAKRMSTDSPGLQVFFSE